VSSDKKNTGYVFFTHKQNKQIDKTVKGSMMKLLMTCAYIFKQKRKLEFVIGDKMVLLELILLGFFSSTEKDIRIMFYQRRLCLFDVYHCNCDWAICHT